MFRVNCTFEDLHINAYSADGKEYVTTISDAWGGEHKTITLTALQLSYIFAFNMDLDGEPEGFEKMYKSLEPLFVGWPNTLRPIP